MPKPKTPVIVRLQRFAEEFSVEMLVIENSTLLCRCCGTRLGSVNDENEMKRYTVTQHINSAKHGKNKKLLAKQKDLNFEKDTFAMELCQTLVASDIPIYKLNNPSLRDFLEKYTGRPIPDQSTIRKNYLDECYETTLASIRNEIGDHPIWVSIDETTDADGRFIGNVIVGKMHSAEPGRPILLNVVQLEKTNNLTIAALMNNSMNLLWPDGIQHFKVLLFVTDGAAYMVKAGKALRNFYPRMVHVTCLAHGLHRIAETVRSSYPITDKFVSSMKKIFLKAPGRITAFKEQYPEIPLPPKPVIVRWGTWLTTVQYYAKYFNEIELLFLLWMKMKQLASLM